MFTCKVIFSFREIESELQHLRISSFLHSLSVNFHLDQNQTLFTDFVKFSETTPAPTTGFKKVRCSIDGCLLWIHTGISLSEVHMLRLLLKRCCYFGEISLWSFSLCYPGMVMGRVRLFLTSTA